MTAGNAVERDSITSKVFERVGKVWRGRGNLLQKVSPPLPILVFRFFRTGLLGGFDLVPEVVLVVEGKVDEIEVALAGNGFHALETGEEAFGGGVQGGGRLDPLAAAKLDEGEHVVAEFVFDSLGVVGSHRIKQFQPFGLVKPTRSALAWMR